VIRASVESLLSSFGIRSTMYLVRRELMLPLAGGSEQGRLPVGYSAMGKLSINYLGSDLAVARQSPRSGCHSVDKPEGFVKAQKDAGLR